ncbi:MAG: hypothetical protein M0Z84_07425 [Gammaproteobacteria bacterium]|nr:hypothetical protein [Gammaproteobacteria bacterium]
MNPVTDRAYGNRTLWLWWYGLRDRLRGDRGRANARWGHVRAPAGGGRLVWIETGAEEAGVRLGAGVLRALRESRHDLRLVLSFEREFPQLLERALVGLERTGFGYGPSDSARAVRRVLRTFAPLGVLMVARRPAPILSAALEAAGIRCVAVHTPAAVAGRFQAAYPADRAQAEAWQQCGRADYIAPRADLTTLLVEAQVDPNFRSALCGGLDLAVWCLLGASPQRFPEIDAWWRDSGLGRRGLLLVGSAAPAAAPPGWLRISAWNRTVLGGGRVVLVDDSRWLPAVAASSDAIHLLEADAWTFWQTLAGGRPVSVPDHAAVLGRLDADATAAARVFEEVPTLAQLERFWTAMRGDPIGGRRRGDGLRRLFWGERRRAADVNRELLARVFAW